MYPRETNALLSHLDIPLERIEALNTGMEIRVFFSVLTERKNNTLHSV